MNKCKPRNIAALLFVAMIGTAVGGCNRAEPPAASGEWIALFDGESLNGWTPSEHKGTWRVEDGALVCKGDRSHLFYTGEAHDHDFTNFELKLEVMSKPGANSGVYFHTQYQEEDWPAHGYEAQVNNTQEDWRRTGSLYSVQDIDTSPVKDDQWFDYHITVRGKQITLTVNGQTTVDYTEPENPPQPDPTRDRRLSHGTIALQAHDPGSVVDFRHIFIKPLP